MSTFFALLPVYIFGNLHCVGMCGPLVLMLGRHRYRAFYFLGRTLSFSLAGALAGSLGAVVHTFLQPYHLSSLIVLFFGSAMLLTGLSLIFKIHISWPVFLKPLIGTVSRFLSVLMLKDRPLPVFLFGLFTILLPCGQTVIVFSAIALQGAGVSGFLNGMAFALFTSPSLFLAMRAENLFGRFKDFSKTALGVSALLVGVLALCRGFAEAGLIPHFIVNPSSPREFHIALF